MIVRMFPLLSAGADFHNFDYNTAMVLIIGLLNLLGGVGLKVQPGTCQWWALRPVKIVILAAVLSVFLAVFGRFEQRARAATATPLSVWRSVGGSIAVCAGLSMLAIGGIWAEGVLGIRFWTVVLALAGAALVLGPPLRRSAST